MTNEEIKKILENHKYIGYEMKMCRLKQDRN